MRDLGKIMSRWWWIWLIHGFFIYAMYEFFYFRQLPWKQDTYRALGLSYEMNYAVWWSGICLFLASLIYFRIAELHSPTRRYWNVLGLITLALCCDEIGSLHETVAELGGWNGLLPFAAILGGGFLWSLYHLFRQSATHLPSVLIFTGVAIFAGVAGLEFIEHNVEFTRTNQRLRLIVEEGSELIAMGLLITAGLLAYLRNSDIMNQNDDISLSSISGVLRQGFFLPQIMFVLFAIQLSVVALLIIPNFSLFPFGTGEGNLTGLYPVLLFISLGLFCLNQAKNKGSMRGRNKKIIHWKLPGYLLIATSIIQLYNLNEFINGIFQSDWITLTEPPTSWFMTLIPWIITVWIFSPGGKKGILKTLGHLGILIVAAAFLSPGTKNLQIVDCYYFLFSSCVAYSCYIFIYDFIIQKEPHH
jgi:hypothetical protein